MENRTGGDRGDSKPRAFACGGVHGAGKARRCGGACGDYNSVIPSYAIGTEKISPDKYLPEYVTDSLKMGISDFDKWLSGYGFAEAVLTGPETRTTSPVRILRDENYEIPGFSGLYPSGEGAGYAGGIISSAVDGIKVAETILKRK